MNSKETKSVIDFKEKTSPEKQQLHQFLLKNDISFVKNSSGEFDAVIRMITPSEKLEEVQDFYQRIKSRSNCKTSISHQQSMKTFTDISTSESSKGQLQRSRKTGSMAELLSGQDKLNKTKSAKTQLSSMNQKWKVEAQTSKKKDVNKPFFMGLSHRSKSNKTIKPEDGYNNQDSENDPKLKEIGYKNEQRMFTSDFNDRWRLNKLKNPPNPQVMQISSQKLKQQSQLSHIGNLSTQTFTSSTKKFNLQSTSKPPINKSNNLPSANLTNPKTLNLTQELEMINYQAQAALLDKQPLEQAHTPAEEKRNFIQLRKIIPDEKMNSEFSEKGQSQQQTFNISLFDDDDESNQNSNNNSQDKQLIPSRKNSESSRNSRITTSKKENGLNNIENSLDKSNQNGCQRTIQDELFRTPSGKQVIQTTKDNKLMIGQSSQFSLNDRTVSSQKKQKNNSKTISMKDSSFNDRISFLQSARYSGDNSYKLSASVPFKSSHDYSPILDQPEQNKQNNYWNIHQESSSQDQNHHQNESRTNLDGISNSISHEEQQLSREQQKVQTQIQQQFTNSPPSPFEQEYFSFTSSPTRFSPAKMMSSPYSNILKDDPWLEVLKNDLSNEPVEVESQQEFDYQILNQEVNLKSLSSSELVQYYRLVMEKARLQSICPAPQRYSVGSFRGRVQ